MDVPPAPPSPTVVIEEGSSCPDREAAEDELRRALESKGINFRLNARIVRENETTTAHAEITDEKGAVLGARDMSSSNPACRGLARALGIWAQLVLDREQERVHAEELPPPPPPPKRRTRTQRDEPPPPPDSPLDLGGSALIMTGTGDGAVTGGSIFALVGGGGGWFVRPSLAFGMSVADATRGPWGAARLDGCGRIGPVKAVSLDLCGGGEIGLQGMNEPAPRSVLLLVIGPSAGFRAQLAPGVFLEPRGAGGLHVGRFIAEKSDATRPPLFVGRFELGLLFEM